MARAGPTGESSDVLEAAFRSTLYDVVNFRNTQNVTRRTRISRSGKIYASRADFLNILMPNTHGHGTKIKLAAAAIFYGTAAVEARTPSKRHGAMEIPPRPAGAPPACVADACLCFKHFFSFVCVLFSIILINFWFTGCAAFTGRY